VAKVTDERVLTLEGYFDTGDKPQEGEYADLIAAIQEAAQDHEHSATGGSGSGTGDASLIKFLDGGADAAKTATPAVMQVYVATDTNKFYVCFTVNVWTQVYP